MAERKPNVFDETLQPSSSSNSPTNVTLRLRATPAGLRPRKTKQRPEEKTRQSSRPTSPAWEDIDEERPQRKSKASLSQREGPGSRRTRTVSSSQLGTVREESSEQESSGLIPKLSRILESSATSSTRRRSSGSVTSGSERSLYSLRSNRSSLPENKGREERKAIRHKHRSQQRRVEQLLTNPSLLSVVSGTTNSSGTSSGSGSTITQKSYDKSSGERRRRSDEQAGYSEGRRESSGSPPRSKPKSGATMDRSNVFAFMVPEIPEENSVEGSQSSSSSSAYAGSDAGSSHTAATSVTSSPPPPSGRTRMIRDEWSAQEKATSDGNASARGSSSERSHRSRRGQRQSAPRGGAESDRTSLARTESRKETDTSGLPQGTHHDDGAEYLRQQYEEALRHQHLNNQAAIQAYYQQADPHFRYPVQRLQDEYKDATASYYTAPPSAPEAPSSRRQAVAPYQQRVPEQRVQSYNSQPLRVPEDPAKTTIVGYEALAAKLSSTDEIGPDEQLRPIYRKFEYLNHRILLHLQDEIAELEEELRQLDECIAQALAKVTGGKENNPLPSSRRAEAKVGSENHHRRVELLGRIFMKIGQYNQALSSYNSMVKSTSPVSSAEIENYRAWVREHKPLVETETRFLDSPGDLLTIAPSREATAGTGAQTLAQLAIFGLPLALVVPLVAFSVVPGLWGRLFVLVLVFGTAAAVLSHAVTAQKLETDSYERFGKEWLVAGVVYFAAMAALAAAL